MNIPGCYFPIKAFSNLFQPGVEGLQPGSLQFHRMSDIKEGCRAAVFMENEDPSSISGLLLANKTIDGNL